VYDRFWDRYPGEGPEGETAPARLAAGEVLKYRKNKKDYFTFTIDI